MAPHVGRQFGDRSVPSFGLLAQRLQDDVVEVSPESAAQTVQRGGGPVRGRHLHDRAGPLGIGLDDRPLETGGRRRRFVGAAAGQQLVEDHPQRIHVARRRHVISPDLFRAGVGRGHRPHRGHGHHGRAEGRLRIERFRDPEIEELRGPVPGDEDVGRLEVAVDDQRPMGGFHRLAHGQEKLEAVVDREALLVAIPVDRAALDVFHDDVGETVLGGPAVEQPGDVGVLQAGQDPPLGLESPQQTVAVAPQRKDLDRDRLIETAVGALGSVDRPHPAHGDPLLQAIRADPAAGRAGRLARWIRLAGRLQKVLYRLSGGTIGQPAARLVRGEEGLQIAT